MTRYTSHGQLGGMGMEAPALGIAASCAECVSISPFENGLLQESLTSAPWSPYVCSPHCQTKLKGCQQCILMPQVLRDKATSFLCKRSSIWCFKTVTENGLGEPVGSWFNLWWVLSPCHRVSPRLLVYTLVCVFGSGRCCFTFNTETSP